MTMIQWPLVTHYLLLASKISGLFLMVQIIAERIAGQDLLWTSLVVRSVLFGLVLAVVLFRLHLTALESMGVNPFEAGNLGTRHLRTVRSGIPISTLTETLRADPAIGRMHVIPQSDGVALRYGISRHSLGERVEIRLVDTAPGAYTYQIRSTPIIPLVMVDYGRNLSHVLRVTRLLGAED
jgi:hypothetical protein